MTRAEAVLRAVQEELARESVSVNDSATREVMIVVKLSQTGSARAVELSTKKHRELV